MNVMRRVVLALAFLSLALTMIGCDDDKVTDSYYIKPDPAYMQDAWPKWSPTDTSLVAYTHFAVTWEEHLELGDYTVWIVDLETSETRYVTSGVVADWSPDGRLVIAHRGSQGIFLVNVDTGDEETLPIRGYTPDFSPCGTMIAFDNDEDPTGVKIYNLETQETRWICPPGEPDWSPDGSKLLCFIMEVYDTAGNFLGTIPYDQQYGYGWHARWSPDGRLVTYGAYCDSRKRNPGIWVINADGTEQQLVACPAAVPSWSPDGRKIAYGARSADGRAMVIWVVGADGTDPTQVTFPYKL
jgi:Tol biopolymer transport system component